MSPPATITVSVGESLPNTEPTRSSFFQPEDEHNRRWRDLVRPGDWENPRPKGRYNLVVIGGGTAGLVTAAGAAGLGARVALIEKQAMGGDCLNVGCVPSKALLAAARSAAHARRADGFGVRTRDIAVDFPAVMERLRRLRADISPVDSAARFRDLGVDVYFGAATFRDKSSIEVGGIVLGFHRAAIATGARAALLPIPGLDTVGALTNETLFTLTELPRRLAVIGAGPIGCEMAQAFQRLGSEVVLFESARGILPREDRDAAAIVATALRGDGVRIACGSAIERVERRGEVRVIHLALDATPTALEFDAILVGVGRQPNVEGLGLEAAGVDFDTRRGVHVDPRLRTTNRRIFAVGDVCLPYRFTHTADATARIVIQNALFAGRKRHTDLIVPWCTYTDPELAHTGLSAEQAETQGRPIRMFTQHFSDLDRAVIEEDTEGFVRLIFDTNSGRILGATIVGPHAGDLISEVTLAIKHRVRVSDLATVIHPYPTMAEAIRKIGDQWNQTRLTPFVQRGLRAWLRWRR